MKLELCTHQELPYKEIYVNGVNIFMLPIEFFILTNPVPNFPKPKLLNALKRLKKDVASE